MAGFPGHGWAPSGPGVGVHGSVPDRFVPDAAGGGLPEGRPWLAIGLLIALAWGLRAFGVAPGPFHENFHGYAALGLDPDSVPGSCGLGSPYLALMELLGAHGPALIAVNRVLSSLVVLPAVLVAADLLGGNLAGVLAGAVVAVHPLLARLGASEDPFAFYTLLLLSAAALARQAMREDRRALLWLAAVLASVAVWVRDSTLVAGPVFVVLSLAPLPRRRWVEVSLACLVPVAAGVVRALCLHHGGAAVALGEGASLLERAQAVAPWASVGALRVLRTPALFPALALGGFVLAAWRSPLAALRLALALGLLQGPFAVALGTSFVSPFSSARHLSPAVVLWTVPAGLLLARVVALVPPRRVLGRLDLRGVAAGLLLVATLADAPALLGDTSLPDREYPVMQRCLERLPEGARVVPLDGGYASHVAQQEAWYSRERPSWRPGNRNQTLDDAVSHRSTTAVLLIDHGCSVDATLPPTPDVSRAVEPSPWGPMVPECARALGRPGWKTVLREDLTLDVAGRSLPVPVGCLIDQRPPAATP